MKKEFFFNGDSKISLSLNNEGFKPISSEIEGAMNNVFDELWEIFNSLAFKNHCVKGFSYHFDLYPVQEKLLLSLEVSSDSIEEIKTRTGNILKYVDGHHVSEFCSDTLTSVIRSISFANTCIANGKLIK